MKKLIGVIILFVMFSSFIVSAGDVLKLDFTKESQYLVGLKKGDRAEFYLNGERNIIIVDKITPESVDITAFIALNTRNYPYYTTLSEGKILKLDVERDDIYDLFITWSKSDEEYVYLLLNKPNTIPTGNVVVDDVKRENRKYDIYLIIGFVLVVILLVFLIFSKKTEKNL